VGADVDEDARDVFGAEVVLVDQGEPATPPKTEPAMARSEVSSRQASSAELPRGVVRL
jgi:hypothetical protein